MNIDDVEWDHDRSFHIAVGDVLCDSFAGVSASWSERVERLGAEMMAYAKECGDAETRAIAFERMAAASDGGPYAHGDVLCLARAFNLIALGSALERAAVAASAPHLRELASDLITGSELAPEAGHLGSMVQLFYVALGEWTPAVRRWATAISAELAISSHIPHSENSEVLAFFAINHGIPQQLDLLVLLVSAACANRSDFSPQIRAYCTAAPLRMYLEDWSEESVQYRMSRVTDFLYAEPKSDFQEQMADQSRQLLKVGQRLIDEVQRQTPKADRGTVLNDGQPAIGATPGEQMLIDGIQLMADKKWKWAFEKFSLAASEPDVQADHRLIGRTKLGFLSSGLRAGMLDEPAFALAHTMRLARLLAAPEVQLGWNVGYLEGRRFMNELAVHHASMRTPGSNRLALHVAELLANRTATEKLDQMIGETRLGYYSVDVLHRDDSERSVEFPLIPFLSEAHRAFIYFRLCSLDDERATVLRVWADSRSELLDANVLALSGRNREVLAHFVGEVSSDPVDSQDLQRLGQLLFPYAVRDRIDAWTVVPDEYLTPLPYEPLYAATAASRVDFRYARSLAQYRELQPFRLASDAKTKVLAFLCPTLPGSTDELDAIEQNALIESTYASSVIELEDALRSGVPWDVLVISAHGTTKGGTSGLVIAGETVTPVRLALQPLPALVVLGSCHSADFAGVSLEADLIEAAYRGGSHAVIAGPGLVSDAAAATVLSEFYCRLKPGISPAVGLAAAQEASILRGVPAALAFQLKYFGA
ncbi:MAG: CHAT domain-containing protein [Actinomycetota bacterium]